MVDPAVSVLPKQDTQLGTAGQVFAHHLWSQEGLAGTQEPQQMAHVQHSVLLSKDQSLLLQSPKGDTGAGLSSEQTAKAEPAAKL